MRTTIGRLRRLVTEATYLSEPELSAKIAAMGPDDVADDDYVDADSGEVVLEKGKKARTSRSHSQHGTDYAERQAQKRATRDAEMSALDAEDAEYEASRPDPVKEYHEAVAAFAANWSDWSSEGMGTAPEDAANDAALGFFTDNPKWRTWARALYMSKAEMQSAVAEFVYEAMTNGKK